MTKKFSPYLALSAISLAMLSSVAAQDESAQLLKVVSDLTQQQAQLAENQTKIDGQLNDLTETIRLARIYMARGGGKHKALPIPKK